jgi:hypothetical protein
MRDRSALLTESVRGRMKSILSVLFILLFSISLKAQIENVIVETYYISDANDATDTTDARVLDAGSKTYRIYIDLKSGYKLTKIYGDANHTLKIVSDSIFFNNIDRQAAYFGYKINTTWFKNNPTLALDSWLTLGLATTTKSGVLKTEDTDGSIIGGTNNSGGSSAIPGGLLVNTDPNAGIPLTTADGLLTYANVAANWIDNGFRNFSGTDTTIFGPDSIGSKFISTNASLQNSGVTGSTSANDVLVAQLTTNGKISFELNVEISDSIGNSIKYVANDSVLLPGEKLSPFLKYPQLCGCKDTKFVEYNAKYACSDNSTCKTLIVFGCTDPLACNYDPSANFNLANLCCYPGFCNDRDISLVCPNLSVDELNGVPVFTLYPNPAQDHLSVQITSPDNKDTKYEIYDAVGRVVMKKNTGIVPGNIVQQIDVSDLAQGLYLFRLFVDNNYASKVFIKH